MIRSSIIYATRVGVVGGAAFLTVQQGIWSSSTQEGAKALTDFREKVIPTTNDYLKKIPQYDQVTETAKSKWNSGLNWSAEVVSELPTTVISSSKYFMDYASKTVFSPTESAPEKKSKDE